MFTAAAKKNALTAIESDLNKIKPTLSKDTYNTLLYSPVLDRQSKIQGVQSLLSKGKFNELTVNFFTVLAENGRLAESIKILNSFEQLLKAHRGEVTITVTSAKVFL